MIKYRSWICKCEEGWIYPESINKCIHCDMVSPFFLPYGKAKGREKDYSREWMRRHSKAYLRRAGSDTS